MGARRGCGGGAPRSRDTAPAQNSTDVSRCGRGVPRALGGGIILSTTVWSVRCAVRLVAMS
eukprot:7325135-Prymnesium_polylepis.1